MSTRTNLPGSRTALSTGPATRVPQGLHSGILHLLSLPSASDPEAGKEGFPETVWTQASHGVVPVAQDKSSVLKVTSLSSETEPWETR